MSPWIRALKFPAFTLWTALALSLPGTGQGAVALSVTPNPAPANQAFTLTLLGYGSVCNTTFTRESVTVSEKRIDLSFVVNTFIVDPIPLEFDAAAARDQIVCPIYDQPLAADGVAPIPPYYDRPTFKMPPLKAGVYEVFATRMAECMYSKPACTPKITPVPAGILEVAASGALTYIIDPTTVAAGQDFDLRLLSYGFNCGTTFDNLSVAVAGDAITLSFLDHARPDVFCTAVHKPYGPTYKMSALKAGTYKVKAYRHPACYPCKSMGETADAGTLNVTGDVPRKTWYLKEDKVQAGRSFNMQLLNDGVGNCQTSFSHSIALVSGGGIHASFLMETHPERVCIQDMRPYGPIFSMRAMRAGIYPVYVTELYSCEVMPPFCAVDRMAPMPSDTLVVSEHAAGLLSHLRADAPKVEMIGTRASFILPQDMGGVWKAELVTLDGRVLGESAFAGAAGQRVSIAVDRAPANAVSLIRLTAPDGGQRFLPIVR
ncbi:MAG TPA: hypothetical protein VJ385_12215 [Fibrobacteria bacterium]|nr:hypothetical protein [Fibrobacteria bacterium]